MDGFHLNSGGFPGFCYCENCRQVYCSRFQADLPAKPDWNSPDRRRFLAWRYDASAANFAILQQAMREERLGVFWTGELAGLEETAWMRDSTQDIGRMSHAFSSVMSNIASTIRDDDLRWVSGMTASCLRSVGGRPPTINLKAQLREGGWPRSSTPSEKYANTAWQALANGARLKMPLVGMPGAGEDKRNMRVISEVFDVLKRHAWLYDDARPAAPIRERIQPLRQPGGSACRSGPPLSADRAACQKRNFKPNWMTRGQANSPVTAPKAELVGVVLTLP